VQAGEIREPKREELLRTILADQGVDPARLVVLTRHVGNDKYVMAQLRGPDRADWARGRMLVAGMQRRGDSQWIVARWSIAGPEPNQLSSLIAQTGLLYVVLVGGLAWLLRRITRPIAALTRRMERFAATREADGRVDPSRPGRHRLLVRCPQ